LRDFKAEIVDGDEPAEGAPQAGDLRESVRGFPCSCGHPPGVIAA
jgi:hypothetical protein